MGKDSLEDLNIKKRDALVLSELARDPQVTSRELRDILEEKHGIAVSHVTVSESIRRMREEEIFREGIFPNEEYLYFSLFEFKFDPSGFYGNWRDALETIRNDEHTFMFFLSDGEYQWKAMMMFESREQESIWIHHCYKEHGELFANIRNSVVTNVLKFGTDPQLFEQFSRSFD